MRKKAFCLVLSKWYVKFVAYEKKRPKGEKRVCLKKKRRSGKKKTTWNAKRKLQRLVRVMSCLDLDGRETRGYVRDEWRICSGCRKKPGVM